MIVGTWKTWDLSSRARDFRIAAAVSAPCIVASLSGAQAQVVTLDFSGAPVTGTNVYQNNVATAPIYGALSVGGYRLSNLSRPGDKQFFGSSPSLASAYGYHYYNQGEANFGSSDYALLERSDGFSFSLQSMLIDPVRDNVSATMRIQAVDYISNQTTTRYITSDSLFGMEEFTFIGLENVRSVRFSHLNSSSNILFDDIKVGPAITPQAIAAPGPIAGAGIPALLGLGGLMFWRRRRDAAAA